jgi:hypothetical protein
VRHLVALLALYVCCAGVITLDAQTRRTPAKKPAPARAAALKTEPAKITCPALLGRGVRTGLEFCDVLSGRDPAEGIRITIPPHTGPAFVSFTLHNRHTYSEEEVKAHRAWGRYLAVVGLLTMEGDLLSRAAVQSEFFTAANLFDRIEGGAGPKGLKAVAPVGAEQVRIEVPADVTEVSLLGERLQVSRRDREATYVLPGTPIATVSGLTVEYRPRPAPAPRKR